MLNDENSQALKHAGTASHRMGLLMPAVCFTIKIIWSGSHTDDSAVKRREEREGGREGGEGTERRE